jgi:FtsH-binding integral membrane protein
MSDFEFLSVLISIIIGLGLTHLISGLGHMLYFRKKSRVDIEHLLWCVVTFFLLVVNWWVALLWRDFEPWNFTIFFTMVLWTISMYIMGLALFPPQDKEAIDYRQLMADNRRWFLATFVTMVTLDVIVSYIRRHGDMDPLYVSYIIPYIFFSLVGIFVKSRKYHLTLAWYVAVTLVGWSFGIRQTLWLG